jgi:hypothetical protein
MGMALSSPLQAGEKYYVSFFLNLAGTQWYRLGTNKVGVRFSSTSYSLSSPVPISNFAHVYSTSAVTDTSNWVQVFGSFTADSSYAYLSLGNFFDDANTDTAKLGSFNFTNYYYIDDVCVSTDSLYTLDWWTGTTGISDQASSVSIYPNPCNTVLTCKFLNESPTGITLIDNKGQIISNIEFSYLIDETSISVSNLPAGLYTLNIKYKTSSIFRKLLVIHP